MSNYKSHIVFLICIGLFIQLESSSQSTSFGNTFIHNVGECVIFGMHDFDKGSNGVHPGIVGTQRDKNGSEYGILGFSDVSPGWKGIGDDSYVDGYVKKYGDAPFVFPIGDNGKYRPIGISGGEGTTAAYFKSNPALAITSDLYGGNFGVLPAGGPFPQSSKNNVIINISDLEYWDIDGENPTKIILTWDIFSEIERITNNDLSKLSILGWDGSKWQIIPSKVDILYLNKTRSLPLYNGGISNKVNGSITSIVEIVPDNYSVFTFGSVASGSVGDYVWEDLNRNGIQEVGEPGIDDVKVELYLNQNDSLLMSTTTDANGQYAFVGVPAGIYYVKFIIDNTYTATIPNQGISALNSDVIFNNNTPPFELKINENQFGMDAGFYRTGTIGNFVWVDDNNNGIQDEFESGIKNVRVELLNKSGELAAATVTNAFGIYSFTNLPPGQYMISVIPPVGYSIGPYKADLNDNIDSDINPINGRSEMLYLVSGQSMEYIDAALSSECAYIAEIQIIKPDCGTADGAIDIIVNGTSGPYSYLWNTGDTSSLIYNIDTGYYSVIISDKNNCLRTFSVDLDYEASCEMICADINTHVYLEGAFDYDRKKMNIKLNQLGYLPGQMPTTFLGKYTEAGQPYDKAPWYMNGIEGMTFESNAVLENNLYYGIDVVDWVLVSLRSNVDEEYEACTRAGLLHEDGHISFDSDYCCLLDPTKEYFITIEHRNHLIVMTPTPQKVVDGEISYDFRSNESYIRLFGAGQKEVSPGVYLMYAANGDQYLSSESAGDINVGDLSEWLRQNGEHSSYYRQDFDLNGDANVQDKSMYLKNIGIFTDVPKGK